MKVRKESFMFFKLNSAMKIKILSLLWQYDDDDDEEEEENYFLKRSYNATLLNECIEATAK